MIDTQYMKDKKEEQREAMEEHIRKMLMELVDQLCLDFNRIDPNHAVFWDRDYTIDIIEKFVTKRRRWL